MKFEKLPVSAFAEVITGGTPSTSVKEYWDNGNIPWLNSGELNKGIINESSNFITEAGLNGSSARMMPPGTVLIALTGATTGLTGLLNIDACANQSVTGILPTDRHDPKYLYYYFKTQRHRILKKAWGGAQPHINQQFVKDYIVPLPPIEDQICIANILSKAESLIDQRKQSIRLLDEFLKSTFLEMFGHPVKNDRKWAVTRLDKICQLERGRFSPRPRNDPSYFGGDYPFIQTGDISRSGNRLKFFSQTINEKGIKVSKKFRKGTIVIAIVGATIGATAILELDTYATDSIIGITVNNDVSNNLFVEYHFRFWKPVLLKNAPQAARANINLEILNGLKFIAPPLELQNYFACIVEKTELLKLQYQHSLQSLENLYGSVSQRSFRGELKFRV